MVRNLRRLKVLEVFLRTRAPFLEGRFDLSKWARTNRNNPVPRFPTQHRLSEVDIQHGLGCGFAGCAAGWACVLPSFQRRGLRLHATTDSVFYPHFTPPFDENRPDHQPSDGWGALENFFDLYGREVFYLFGWEEYPTEAQRDPLAVAERIRQFIAGEEGKGQG